MVMRVVFRTDASEQMGSGHMMRCLTLAQALIKRDAQVAFICRDHPGDLVNYLIESQIEVFVLSNDAVAKNDAISQVSSTLNTQQAGNLYHSRWLGVSQDTDFGQAEVHLKSFKPDWLIVDHYALDERWEKQAAALCERIFVIDDLGDRRHHCSILLDQTFGCALAKYQDLVPAAAMLLTGSEYSLLRPEFVAWREYSIRRRVDSKGNRFLIFMGGMDLDNITGVVISQIAKFDKAASLEITVVLGKSCPNIEAVNQQLLDAPFDNSQLLVGISNMAEVMANHDLAIGAAGSATWERCCLAIPSIQYVIARNQQEISQKMGAVKAVEVLTDVKGLGEAICYVLTAQHKLSFASSAIADGRGVDRVLTAMQGEEVQDISLRPIAKDDANFIFSMQNEDIRKYFRNSEVPSYSEHLEWFDKIYNSLDSQVLIIEYCAEAAGVLRLDHLSEQLMEVSIIVAPGLAGQGFGKKALLKLEQLLSGRILKAEVHEDNKSSMLLFESCDYKYQSSVGEFMEFVKHV